MASAEFRAVEPDHRVGPPPVPAAAKAKRVPALSFEDFIKHGSDPGGPPPGASEPAHELAKVVNVKLEQKPFSDPTDKGPYQFTPQREDKSDRSSGGLRDIRAMAAAMLANINVPDPVTNPLMFAGKDLVEERPTRNATVMPVVVPTEPPSGNADTSSPTTAQEPQGSGGLRGLIKRFRRRT